jgi:hypothetical protein
MSGEEKSPRMLRTRRSLMVIPLALDKQRALDALDVCYSVTGETKEGTRLVIQPSLAVARPSMVAVAA